MISFRRHYLLVILFFFCIISPVPAQMPDWQPFRDSEGNIFYCDRAGKIFITDDAVYPARTVSSDGIDYYYHLGAECLRTGNYRDGLRILKAVSFLTVSDERIRDYSKKAAEDITRLKRTQGPRFDRYNEEAEPVLYKENGITTVVNESMDYSLRSEAEIDVVRINRRFDGRRKMFGLTLGLKSKPDKSGYDCLFALESEKNDSPWRSLDEVIENARFRHGADNMKRIEQSRSASRAVYSIRIKQEESFSGYECITYSGATAHIMRIITAERNFDGTRQMMEKVIEAFRPVGR